MKTVADLVEATREAGKGMTNTQIDQVVVEAMVKFGLSGSAADTLRLVLISGKQEFEDIILKHGK